MWLMLRMVSLENIHWLWFVNRLVQSVVINVAFIMVVYWPFLHETWLDLDDSCVDPVWCLVYRDNNHMNR